MMNNLNKKTWQNTLDFNFIKNHHAVSTLKSQITNFIKEFIKTLQICSRRNLLKTYSFISEILH